MIMGMLIGALFFGILLRLAGIGNKSQFTLIFNIISMAIIFISTGGIVGGIILG